MKPYILKALSIAILGLAFVVCAEAQCSEKNPIYDDFAIMGSRASSTENTTTSGCCCLQSDSDARNDHAKSKGCTHWGLKSWFRGIKEYVIDRCICCAKCGFDPKDRDRAYKSLESDTTTDCGHLLINDEVSECYDNPIVGTLCFPFAALKHLICLPVMCCYPNKQEWDMVMSEDPVNNALLRRSPEDIAYEDRRALDAAYFRLNLTNSTNMLNQQQIYYQNQHNFYQSHGMY